MDFRFLGETFMTLLAALPLTLYLALVSSICGALGALVLALMRLSSARPLSLIARAYVFVFRGTPLLIQLFLIYYGLGQFRPSLQMLGLWPFFRDPIYCTIAALAMNTAAYGSEIVRGGLAAVPRGAVEAAIACGMSPGLRFRRVVLPLATRIALPAYGNELIVMVKATSLASTITIMEVTGIAGKLIAETYRTMEIFACAAAIYLLINFVLTRLVLTLEWWMSPDRTTRRVLEQIGETKVKVTA
ncbi:MAG: ABC transporter permease subunit [Azospirillaceae bacterium]|nr:ABC transporter permease subunit [Azospirillaceae bacterium]